MQICERFSSIAMCRALQQNWVRLFAMHGLSAIELEPSIILKLKLNKELGHTRSSWADVFILTNLNLGVGGPWIFSGYGTFLTLQKKSFGQNIFLNFMPRFKIAIFNSAKMALLTRAWNSFRKLTTEDFLKVDKIQAKYTIICAYFLLDFCIILHWRTTQYVPHIHNCPSTFLDITPHT